MANFSDNLRGSMLMMAAMAAFTFNDACMKVLSDELPLFQAVFVRSTIICILMLALARMTGALKWDFTKRDWALIGLRALMELVAAYLFLTALFNMPLANATAILQALPLTVTLAGAVFLGEAVGWRRLLAILIGFVGVLLIIQPGGENFNVYSVYVVLAVVVVTVRDLAARRISSRVPSLMAALVAVLLVTLGSGLGALSEPWIAMDARVFVLLMAASVFASGGYVFSVMTMRIGDISLVTPFRYTSLIWALLLGFVVFGDWPNQLTLFGAAIVVATGIFTLIRERRLANQKRLSH